MECSNHVRLIFLSYTSISILTDDSISFPLSTSSTRNRSYNSYDDDYHLYPSLFRLTCTRTAKNSLTGLLSFMLSDEMTTGSVTSSDTHKRAFAARSHAWNLTQARFRDAFPEVRLPFLLGLYHDADDDGTGIPNSTAHPNQRTSPTCP